MARQGTFIATLKEHKRWADAAAAVSIVLLIGLMCITAYLADAANTDQSTRIGMYIMTVGVVVVVCIWQAAAFVAASIELAVRRRIDERGPWA